MIINEILDFYFYCQLKAQYKSNNLQYTNLSYNHLHNVLEYQAKYLFQSLEIESKLLKDYILKNNYYNFYSLIIVSAAYMQL